MSNQKWIAYLGNFPFPEGRASSRRVYGVASALVEAGYDVVVLSEDAEAKAPAILFDQEGKGRLSYLGLSERVPKDAPVTRKAYQYLIVAGKRKVRWLDEQPDKPAYVIYYGSASSYMFRLLAWCRKNKVPLIVDICEWRDASHTVGGGRLSPFNISDKFCMRFLIPRANGVIAGSSFLEDFYLRKNTHVIRIPIVLDTARIIAKQGPTDRGKEQLTLAYTGNPGKGSKDLLNNVLEALFRIITEGKDVSFIMAGPSDQDILYYPALQTRSLSSLPPWIKALGWQPADIAIEIVRKADFMPLLRPMNRTSAAGSPTKFFESMAVGTPVICNLTSDLGLYLHDGVEGLVCRDSSVAAFSEALERALALSPEHYLKMRIAARDQAEESFDFRGYVEPLGHFLEKIHET